MTIVTLLRTLVTVFSGDFTGCSGGGLDFLFDGVLLILGEWNLSFSFIVKDVKWERWDSEGKQNHYYVNKLKM